MGEIAFRLLPEAIDSTATQVRLDGPDSRVHGLVRVEQHPAGRVYWAACGDVLSNVAGAVLTTRPVTCNDCWRNRSVSTGKGNASQASGSPGRNGGS